MLLRYVIKKPVPLRYRHCCSRNLACSFATSTTFERTIEYEIDLISLKKTTRGKLEPSPGKFKFNPFNLTRLESKLINPDIVTRSVNEVKQDPLDYQNFPNNDSKGHLEFIERYNVELRKFLEFIQLSNERKLQVFNQLTSEEMMNSLYIFKDNYQKGGIEGITKYNYKSYNYMFERLCKYLRYDSNFPVFLQSNLSNDFENNKIIMDLYKFGIGKFVNELSSVATDYPFGRLSIVDITSAIDKRIEQYDKVWKLQESSADYNEPFFKGCIQIQRYKHLKSILEALPVKPTHLLYILNNENSRLIVNKINSLSGEKENFEKIITIYQAELNFIKFLAKDSFETFPKLASFLYKHSIAAKDKLTQNVSLSLSEVLTPFFTNGTLQDSDLNMIELEFIPPAIISKLMRQNYEFSVLAKIELFDFIDELRILRAFSNKRFESLDVAGTFEQLNKLITTFRGSSIIVDNLQVLELELCTLSKYISWDLSVLDKLIDNPSWASYLNEIYETGFDKSRKIIDFTERTPIVTRYLQIPDDLFLHEFFNELEIVKSDLLGGFDFKVFSHKGIIGILEHAIDEAQTGYNLSSRFTSDTVNDFIKLNGKLRKLFQVNGGNTGILDTVIHSQSVFESVAKKSKTTKSEANYTAIGDDIELHKYSKELTKLRSELGSSYTDCTSEQIHIFLSERINDVFNGVETQFSVTKDNIGNFLKLEENLNKFFKINENPAILDTLIHSQSVFEDFEKKKAQKMINSYTQIPDNLELHKFYKILEVFREDELRDSFGVYSAEQIKCLMNRRINEINGDLPNCNITSRMNKTNVHDFMLLVRKITKLFDINGRDTGILDTLIQSQSVFDKFEKSKASFNSVYKQIPDSFVLEEYMLELIQLKMELGGNDFKSFDCITILDKLKKMITNKKKFNLDKRIAYSKLYRNIFYLFKYNGNNTFILDNVLVSGEVFAKFEADKAFFKPQQSENSIVLQNAGFVNEFNVSLKELFDQLRLDGTSDFVRINRLEFDKHISQFSLSNNENSYQYPVYLDMIDKIRFFNLKINNYPLFLYSLVQKRNAGEIIKSNLAKSVYEESNRRMHEEFIENQNKTKLSVPVSESRNKFDMNDFMEGDKHQRRDYTDSAALLTLLSKQKSSANLKSNRIIKPRRSNDGLLKSEWEIKDAVAVALNNKQTGINHEDHDEQNELKNLTSEKVRESFKNYKPSSTTSIPTSQIDKSSIESFLNNAKKEKELARERKFRESKAYEWSRNMYNSHRSLESHNFFDPIVPISKISKESKELFFPKLNNGDVQYLLLTINGQKIISEENPLGKNALPEDMFTTLNKFTEEDLRKFLKNVKKLQKNNWTLIGGGGGGGKKEKMLVLTRKTSSKKGIYLARIKTMFATTGAVFLVLISLNLWLDDHDTIPLVVSTPVDSFVSNSDIKEETSTNLDTMDMKEEISLWRKLLWSTK